MYQKESKFCYYFNNNQKCPYNEIGCMFKHEVSSPCWLKQCTRNLCQYQHSDASVDESTDAIEETLEEDQVECLKCKCTFLDQAELDYHVRVDHTETLDEEIEDASKDAVEQSPIYRKQCHLCHTFLNPEDNLVDHMETNHREYFDEMSL